MSLKVMTWAWTIRLPPVPKLVLMALADEADDRGFCFPSQRHLADKCNLSERSVRRMLGVLMEQRHVAIERRFRKGRARTSNGYRLGLDPPGQIGRGPRSDWPGGPDIAVSGGPGQRWPGAPDNGVRLTTTEPCIYPLPPPESNVPAVPVGNGSGRGGSGDLCFSKALSKAQTRAIQGLLAELVPEDAQAVLDELAGRMATTQVKNPIRYCAALAGRLKRGEFRPELGVQIAGIRSANRARGETLSSPPKMPTAAANADQNHPPENVRKALQRLQQKLRTAQSIDPSRGTDDGQGDTQ